MTFATASNRALSSRPAAAGLPSNHGPILQRLLDATSAKLQWMGVDGRVRAVSDAWLTRFGYTRDEVVGHDALEFIAPHSRAQARSARAAELFRLGRIENIGLQYVAKDGEIVDVLFTAVTDDPPDGRPQGRVAIIEDLTHWQKRDRELIDDRRRLLNIIEATGVGTWEWNIRTGDTTVNERWTAILGHTIEDLSPITIETRKRLTHPDDLEGFLAALQHHFKRKTPHYEFESRLRHRAGHYVWVLSRGTVGDRDAEGRPTWMFGTIQDISERKRQEEALRKSEAFLERTGRLAGVGGWELDLVTNRLDWSDETTRIHGLPPGFQPDVETAIEFYAPEARPKIRAAVEASIETGQGWDLELPLIRADGTRIFVRAAGASEYVDGKPVRLIGVFQDMTAQVAARAALERANQRINLATESGGVGIWDWNLVDGQIEWDPRMRSLFGVPAGEPLDRETMWRHVHPEDVRMVRQEFRRALAGADMFKTYVRVILQDGGVRHLRVSGRVIRDAAGIAVQMVGANWDVTERQHLANQLAEQNELLEVTLQSIGDGVITTDADGRLIWLNPVAERLTGWSAGAAAGHPLTEVFRIVDADMYEPAADWFRSCRSEGRIVTSSKHAMLVAQNGLEYGVEASAAPIRSRQGKIVGAVVVFRDVTEQQRLATEMTYRASHDMLTGLVNRSEFEARLARLLQPNGTNGTNRTDGGNHAVLFIDLDQFKIINDTCGHSAGDRLLKQVSGLLTSSIRGTDTLARVGGDEFAIILENASELMAQRLAQRICDTAATYRFRHDNQVFRIGASVGLVAIDDRWTSPEAVMLAADKSCYAAKEAGRNRVHVWYDTDQVMLARQGETQWATRLERALDQGSFVLFAQRIEPLNAERTSAAGPLSAEVLLRLREPDGTLVLPGAFLPAAERFHLAVRIDRWVVGHAIGWLRRLPSIEQIGLLTINLSGQSVTDHAFHRWTLDILAASGSDICERVCFELTETAAVTNLSMAAVFLEQVRSLGARVALDDFGAGASSFGYLRTLPVDFLKIDGQFVRNLATDRLDEAAVRSFVDVAKVVGIQTIAEFVDDKVVLGRLREMGVDHAQGYLLHRPAPIDSLVNGRATLHLPQKALLHAAG